MSRSVPMWHGRTADSAIPPRVRLRLFERANGRCEICARKLGPGDKWQVDHIQALANGGAHSEANMRIACDWCHKAKTREDVAAKAKTATVKARHLLPRKPSRLQGAPFPKREPARSASTPLSDKFANLRKVQP